MEEKPAQKKSIRPVLIVSERICYEYSMSLRHLLTGLADESIPAALVCRSNCNVGSIISPTVEVVQHPVIDLPLTGHPNRRMLIERLGKFRPTVLHCLCESKGKLAMQLARELNLPYVLTVNSLRSRKSRLHIHPHLCARLLVPADSIAANLKELYPKFPDRITQIGLGTSVEEQRCCFGQNGDVASLVTTHPIDNANQFENLLNAVRHLVIDGYELMLVIMGSGRAEQQLRKLVRVLKLLWVVTIVPRLEPWRSVISASDIFLRPQPRATFDPFLLEAMSTGSVVAACRGGVDDLIIDGKTCSVFDPADELSVYNCLHRLLDRRESARQLARQAQQYVREKHAVSKMITDILQAYNDAEVKSKQ